MDALSFTTLFPNPARPRHGLFVARRLAAVARAGVGVRVIAPVPRPVLHARLHRSYAPAEVLPARTAWENLPVCHPRYPMAPGLGLVQPQLLARACRDVFAQEVARRRPALVDAHYLYPDGVAAALLARRFDLPLVLTARGSDVNRILALAGYRRQILRALDRAARVITVSEALRQTLLAQGLPETKVVTIRNGVDPALFRPRERAACRRALGWPQATPVLLSVGHLVAHKRHRLLLPLLRDLPTAQLVILGEGPERASLRQTAERLGVGARLLLPGEVPPAEVAQAYAAADLLLHPSEREGLPNVVLEAMACGCPVVAAPVGGLREVVPPSPLGALVDPKDEDALLEAVRGMLANPPARCALLRHAARFSWSACAQAVVRLFAEVARQHHAGTEP